MAYATGSVIGLNNFYDALYTFATATCGWSAIETIGGGGNRDRIIYSAGVDGKQEMFYRMSTSTSAGNPFKAASNVHKALPWVLVQGYNHWTAGAPGTGQKQFGQVGPWLLGSPISGGAIQSDSIRIHRFNGTFPLVNPADSNIPGRTRRIKTADPFETDGLVFDGRRKLIGASNVTKTQVAWADLVHGETNLSSGGIPPIDFQAAGISGCLVHDAVNDKDYWFTLNNTAALATQWLRYDFETNTWSTMAAPIWTATAPSGGISVWDGADTIYSLRGNGSTEFAKYSISGNSWTNLTAAPVGRPNGFAVSGNACVSNAVYVPNTASGLGEDVIYAILAASGTTIYRYDVTANAWRSTSGTGALTAQQTIAVSTFLVYDGIDTLIHATSNAAPTTWYKSTVTAPNVWTSMGTVQSAARPYHGIVSINHIPCKIRSHATANTKYWFLGDLDSITVVVKIETATPHYYWMHFGKFNGSNRTDIMTLTAPAAAGGRVTIPVNDTSKYSAGETVVFWNHLTGATERTTIYDIPTGTTFRANIAGNYTADDIVGIDPTQWCAVGNGIGLCPSDATLPQTASVVDNEPAQYVAEATIDPTGTLFSSPGVRGLYQPVPITLFNRDSTTSKAENRGFLKNVFMSSAGAFPQAQPEDQIKIGGKTYLFFTDTETSRYIMDTRGIMIGPID